MGEGLLALVGVGGEDTAEAARQLAHRIAHLRIFADENGRMSIDKVNLAEKLAAFDETWVPKVVGELNDQHVKVAKIQGEYVWHQHEEQDELFLVLSGRMELCFRDKVVELGEGEFCIVPHGVEHKPVARELCRLLVFEPASTRNTGDMSNELTIEPEDLERI